MLKLLLFFFFSQRIDNVVGPTAHGRETLVPREICEHGHDSNDHLSSFCASIDLGQWAGSEQSFFAVDFGPGSGAAADTLMEDPSDTAFTAPEPTKTCPSCLLNLPYESRLRTWRGLPSRVAGGPSLNTIGPINIPFGFGIVVRNIDESATDFDIASHFHKIAPVTGLFHAKQIYFDQEKSVVIIGFECIHASRLAVLNLDCSKINGKRINVRNWSCQQYCFLSNDSKLLVHPSVLEKPVQEGSVVVPWSARSKRPDLPRTNRLLIKNIAHSVTMVHLHSFFSQFGSLTELLLPLGLFGQHRNYAFVSYSTDGAIKRAFHAVRDRPVKLFEKRLWVYWADPKP
jgi:hypothetical protein